MGGGSYSLTGVDSMDGDLTNNDTDAVVLTGIGVQGDARYKLQTTLTGVIAPLTCLEVSLHAGGDIVFNNATVTSDQTISANGSVTETGSTINANVEAAVAISGTGYTGTQTTGITPRSVPDPGAVFAFYSNEGTTIDVSALPFSGGSRMIENVLLSPISNPFGLIDPDGIYVIDLLGQKITFHSCRIIGTIVLLNPDPSSNVANSVLWEPSIANYPSLLVNGGFEFNGNSAVPLTESSPPDVNFNPVGAPYNGDEDDLLDDSYPAVINGLVYVSGDVSSSGSPAFDGVVVSSGTVSASGLLTLVYGSTFLDTAPPEFTEPPHMVVSEGSWRRVVD